MQNKCTGVRPVGMQGVPPLKLGGPPGMLLVNTAWNNNWLRTVHSKTIEFLSNSQSYNKPLTLYQYAKFFLLCKPVVTKHNYCVGIKITVKMGC